MTKTKPLALLLVAILAVAGGCGNTAKKEAPPLKVSDNTGLDPQAFKQLWMADTALDAGDSLDHLYVAEDIVFASTPKNVSYVINRSSGVLQYFNSVDGGGREVGRPQVLPQFIVYAGVSTLQVYKRKTGDLDHSIPLGFTITSGMAGVDDEVYFGGNPNGGRVADVKVDDLNRPLQWTMMMFGPVEGAPAVYQSVLYVGSGDGGVRGINQDRNTVWILDKNKYDTGGAITGDIKVDGDGVYAASNSGRLVCIKVNDGQLVWQYFAPHGLTEGPVVTKTSVYQRVPDLGMVAIDKVKKIFVGEDKHKVDEQNRTPRWVSRDAAQFLSEDEQNTYVRTVDNSLLALDRVTGEVRYRVAFPPFVAYATNITDSTIYAATATGRVYALKPVLQPGVAGYQEAQ